MVGNETFFQTLWILGMRNAIFRLSHCMKFHLFRAHPTRKCVTQNSSRLVILLTVRHSCRLHLFLYQHSRWVCQVIKLRQRVEKWWEYAAAQCIDKSWVALIWTHSNPDFKKKGRNSIHPWSLPRVTVIYIDNSLTSVKCRKLSISFYRIFCAKIQAFIS